MENVAATLPVRAVILRSFRSLILDFGTVIAIAWFPMLMATETLYLSLDTYFLLLAKFLQSPNGRSASLALGAVTIGALIWLFLCSIVVAGFVEFFAGRLRPRWIHLRAGRPEWRLFAAGLRFVAVLAAFSIGYFALATLAGALLPAYRTLVLQIAGVVYVGLATWLVARLGFLLPAVAVLETHQVVRRSWILTRHVALNATVICFALIVLPGLLAFEVGELLSQMLHVVPAVPIDLQHLTAHHSLQGIRRSLPAFVITLSISTMLGMVLAAAGSAFAYPALAAGMDCALKSR